MSPHAWGWTVEPAGLAADFTRCPHTRGGGPRVFAWAGWPDDRCPHTRGGGPTSVSGPWRCSTVVPTRVGVDRSSARAQNQWRRVVPTRVGVDRCRPGTRGRGPGLSPHAWGWTGVGEVAGHRGHSCPHTRGGGPSSSRIVPVPHTRCPHTRGGGPVDTTARQALLNVVPTRVGVDRTWYIWTSGRPIVVPTRVGVDRPSGLWRAGGRALSPHAWGWTVSEIGFPGLEVCCPHTRGGGPADFEVPGWGNFRCPHTRGGGPFGNTVKVNVAGRCPHTRGGGPATCYHCRAPHYVVPTRVGVDRAPPT